MEATQYRQGGTILLVDDDDAVREMLGEILSLLGHRIVSHANGQEAFGSYCQSPPDLLITDIDMPVMNGLELIRAVRDENAALPIMAISGEAGHLIAAENLGASDTFIKPIDFKRLKSAISEHLG